MNGLIYLIGMAIDIHTNLGSGFLENKLVLELKSDEELNDVHLAQTLTYLKLDNYKLDLLINFNVPIAKKGIRRFINT